MFQSGVMALIAGLMSTSTELLELDQMFKQFDIDNDGTLSREELESGMRGVIGEFAADLTDWEEFFDAIDSNHDGKIDYQEFITASVKRANFANKNNMDNVFSIFDADGDGFITKEELKAVFQGKLNMNESTDLIDEAHESFDTQKMIGTGT